MPNAVSQKVQGALGVQGRNTHPGLRASKGSVGFLLKGVTKLRHESMQQASRTWHLEGNSVCEGGGQPRQVGIQEQEIGSRERGGRKGRQALVRKAWSIM